MTDILNRPWLPNAVTLGRLAAVPLLVWLLTVYHDGGNLSRPSPPLSTWPRP